MLMGNRNILPSDVGRYYFNGIMLEAVELNVILNEGSVD